MTHEEREAFVRSWPELADRLRALLKSRGISDPVAEDAVQETGLRLVRDWTAIDKGRPLWPLASTIAMNVVRDEFRKGRDKELVAEMPERAAPMNVEEQVLARLEVGRTARALSRMSERQRGALLADLGPAKGEALSAAAKMLRLRARRRLIVILDTISIGLMGISARIRRQGDWLQPAAAAVVTAAVVVSLGGTVSPSRLPGSRSAPIQIRTATNGGRVAVAAAGSSQLAPAAVDGTVNATDIPGAPIGDSPAHDTDDSTTLVEVDGVDNTPERTTIQVLDTKVKTNEEGSATPVCVEGGPPLTPAPVACPAPAPKRPSKKAR